MTTHKLNFNIILNVVFWLGMYLFWLGFNRPAMPGLEVNLLFTLVDFVCFLLIALITAHILIPSFLYQKKYLKFILFYLLVLFSITSLMVLCNYWILKPYRPGSKIFSFNLNDLAGSYLLAFFLCSASSIFKLVNDFYHHQSIINELKQEKIKSELEFLKLQVNPHSFFNILNTIYFQIDLDKESAKHSVMLFSRMFRYQLYECEADKVPLQKEVDFIDNFVQMNKKRFDSDYGINFQVNKSGSPEIAPFLLFPLIENSFKHVSQYIDKPNEIDINIRYDENTLECCVTNTSENEIDNENGIGLKNLKRRLQLLYKDRHVFYTGYEAGIYKAQLKLAL
jgi:sensor histidine kinase YesM